MLAYVEHQLRVLLEHHQLNGRHQLMSRAVLSYREIEMELVRAITKGDLRNGGRCLLPNKAHRRAAFASPSKRLASALKPLR